MDKDKIMRTNVLIEHIREYDGYVDHYYKKIYKQFEKYILVNDTVKRNMCWTMPHKLMLTKMSKLSKNVVILEKEKIWTILAKNPSIKKN